MVLLTEMRRQTRLSANLSKNTRNVKSDNEISKQKCLWTIASEFKTRYWNLGVISKYLQSSVSTLEEGRGERGGGERREEEEEEEETKHFNFVWVT